MTAAARGLPAATPPPAAELPWLVGDIGGTNARFGWVQAVGGSALHVRTLPVAAHDGPASAVRAYLAGLQAELGGAMPRRAALAVATAIGGDRVELTNSHWRFSIAGLQTELGLRSLAVLNDFEALALSLPRLQPAQVRWQGPAPQAHGTMAVIGPGTGLGVGGVVHTRAGWQALPGEGGHATLSASDEFEAQLLAQVRRTHEHVSAERLLSGIGLPLLHQSLAAVRGVAAPVLAAQAIVERGLAPPGDAAADPLCSDTIEAFCALLGSFAGNVALTLGARGGVYIGGGIVPRLGDRFVASRFRERFEAKGRFRGYLAAIPTPLITDTLVALSGAAAAIEQSVG
ncbi:glucokinase [Ideonella sp. A 288]|uniref:glucokinase n=1 Tax=Ideonella sp. A 288 TaxID=1962181 RepID=UPI001F16C86B|nr:glucokinase [Ideonella sp. A 288]